MLRRKKRTNTSVQAAALMDLTDPKTAEEFTQRGWNHYTKKEYFRAESDFKRALELSPQNPDIIYAHGLTLQASGNSPEAISQFQKIIDLLQSAPEEEKVRTIMLTRLSRGHINKIKTGDWHLEG